MAATDQSCFAERLTSVLVADPGDLPIRASGRALRDSTGLRIFSSYST